MSDEVKWDYTVATDRNVYMPTVLNELGDAGWELVSTTYDQSEAITKFYFKRRRSVSEMFEKEK